MSVEKTATTHPESVAPDGPICNRRDSGRAKQAWGIWARPCFQLADSSSSWLQNIRGHARKSSHLLSLSLVTSAPYFTKWLSIKLVDGEGLEPPTSSV